MFKNYLKMAIRYLLRHKSFSFINISGLAIGISCCLLIILYIQDELSYDRFHEKAHRIYRVAEEINWSGGYEEAASAQFPVAPALLNDFPDIVQACRLFQPRPQRPLIRYGDKKFMEDRFFFTDSTVLDVFSFELIKGNPETALRKPNSVVITEEIARKYFGDEEPLGKLLIYQNDQTLAVTGVVRNIPHNSHFKFDFLVPFKFYPGVLTLETNWYWNAFWTYLVLPDEQAAAALEKQFPNFVQKYFPESIRDGVDLYLQRLTDIHLRSHLSNEIDANGNIVYLYVFAAIAFLVLLIACINFMNLATARSAGRAKEVGMRKVLGAYRLNLIKQFLTEAILLGLIAVGLAIGIIDLCLPLFNDLAAKELDIHYFDNWIVLCALVGIGVFAGIVSGSYPAFFLSAYRPIAILKGLPSVSLLSKRTAQVGLRKILVVAQFVVSIVLLIGIAIISDQVNYFRNKNLGFDKEQIVLIRSRPSVNQRFEAFENELLQGLGVLEVSRAIGSIPGEPTWTYRFLPEGWPREKPKAMPLVYVDYDFLKIFNLKLVMGRDFSKDFPTDLKHALILNETAVKELGWGGEPLGKDLEYFGAGSDEIEKAGQIIGVVKDFHFESLHKKVQPLVLTLTWPNMGDIVVKTNSADIPNTLDFLEKKWQKFAPEWPFEYSFLDENLDKQYRQEARLGQIIQYFTFLAIFIACLGLFGLASFTAEQRTKEIGVRKVLGASALGIVLLLSKEFTKLVAMAFIVAAPIAYFAMNQWLQDFAYRIDISAATFLIAGGLALLVALLTVSYQAIKAALANPINALRYE